MNSSNYCIKVEQKKRFHFIDMARSFSLLTLPLIHCYEEYASCNLLTDAVLDWGQIFLYICIIAPAVFMICLGMNITFSASNTVEKLVKRGLKIIVIFFVLNIFRNTIPAFVSYFMGCEDGVWCAFYYFLNSDILFFAGLTFLFFAFIKKYNIKSSTILLISLICLTINTLISGLSFGNDFVDAFMGNFYYINEDSCFPFLSWIIFPVIGYIFGNYFINLEQSKYHHLFKSIILFGIVIISILSITLYTYNVNPLLIAANPANYYITDFFNVIFNVITSFVWISIFYFIYSFVEKNSLFSSFSNKLSKSILSFFCIHWIIIGTSEYIMSGIVIHYPFIIDTVTFIIISIIVLITSVWLSFIHLKIKEQQNIKEMRKFDLVDRL